MRALATRLVVRLILAVVGLIFVLGALVFAHVAAWLEVRSVLNQPALVTAGILGGGDLVVAVLLLFVASRSSPGRVEVEALEVRRKAIAGIGNVFSLAQMAIPLMRLIGGMRRRRRE